MPELPEVETVVRDLRSAGIVGRRITDAAVYWPRTIAEPSPRLFVQTIRGRIVEAVSRRAKYIVFTLSGGDTLLVHLRMTGQLSFHDPHAPREKHQHVVLTLDDGRELRFRDTRKFGRWHLLSDPATKLQALGPEPLDRRLTATHFATRLAARRGMLKPLLLNQQFIAGLGNIYVDEALWDARLHPKRPCVTLDADERRRLYRSIRRVLRRGISGMGTTLGHGATNFYSVGGRRGRHQDHLNVFRRVGQPCPRCGEAIVRLIVGQRSSHICLRCQPLR